MLRSSKEEAEKESKEEKINIIALTGFGL